MSSQKTRFAEIAKNEGQNDSLLNPSHDDKHYLKSGDTENTQLMQSNQTNHQNQTIKEEAIWKPAINVSYETIALTTTSKNNKVRPAGFRSSGKHRQIKNTSMISKIRTRCRIRKENPKLAICITMYNEDESELRHTLKGCIHNYNTLKLDPKTNFTKDDFLVVVVVDGYDRIPASFKLMAREKGFLDEEVLFQKGFMDTNRDNDFKMKTMRDVMDDDVEDDKVPTNILHCFQCTTWDFGIDAEILKGRRINFMFCIKQRNDGKINSHKWFFQGVCKYLKPQYCLMLDIGTKPDNYALQKLYNFMRYHPQAGGVCGEIEVDIQPGSSVSSYMVQAAQFYEYKLGHTPDKAFESFFGFTSVLPGAYSIFRWKAIKGSPLDTFFKNVTSTETPTCAEANEYLAEDRVMCLQVYIKENTGYTVQYIPDAKAFTDGPQSLTVLMKQRRRWMNGALFGTKSVIFNMGAMVSCGRNDHPCYRQLLMVFFMIYLTTLYLLQFLTVGAMFVTIMIFYDKFFEVLFVETSTSEFMNDVYTNGILKKVLFSSYLGMIFVSTFVSISLPIDRAMNYFRFVAVMMAILMLSALAGITYYLAVRGLFPPVEEKTCEPMGDGQLDCVWSDVVPAETYFSLLTLAGILMLMMYLVPFIMRPLDFLQNFKNYTLGFLSYMLMMPVFTNVFQIYAMCNLHDVSWGNRPTSTGQEAFTANKATQVKSEIDYKVYRTNFVFIWMGFNVFYYLLILELIVADGNSTATIRDSDAGYLAYFSLFLASLVCCRLFFASIYILKWKCRYTCDKKYRVVKRNLMADFKKIKRTSQGESTDDEEIEKELNKIYEQNKNEIDRNQTSNPMEQSMGPHAGDVSKLDQTLAFVAKTGKKEDESDEDYDFKEFEDAGVEEAEDRIYSEYKRKQADGQVMDEQVLQELAGNVPLDDMDQSVIMSARQGAFSRPRKNKNINFMKKEEESLLDLSVMLAQPEKRSRMEMMMEQTAQSQGSNKGHFNRIFKQNDFPNQQRDRGQSGDNSVDLFTSNKGSEIAIDEAKKVIRNNAQPDKGTDMLRQSKAGSSFKKEQVIEEENSMDNSHNNPSADIDVQNSNGSAMANIFAQTESAQASQHVVQSSGESNSNSGGGGLAGIFAQSAAEQNARKKRPF